MKITVVGAGNIGLAITAYIAIKHKADVTLFTKKSIDSIYLNMDEQKICEQTKRFSITDNPEIAFLNADIIFVTYPSFLRKKFIERNQQYIRTDAYFGFVPGYGGAEYTCVDMIDRGVNIFGFQRVPYIARISKDKAEKTVSILSSKKELFVAAIPKEKAEEISEIVEKLLDIPVRKLKEYLSVTLALSNPLLHISGLYNIFKDYKRGKKYDHPLKLYEEWNDKTSKLLFIYDGELQEICQNFRSFDMNKVIPLPIYYDSPTPEVMTKKLKSIESFKVVMAPLKKTHDGYFLDLSSRMFAEDYPFGICIIKDFARILNIKTPTVDILLDFYRNLSGHVYFNTDGSYTSEIKDTGVPGINGLNTKDKLIDFYNR